jgi:hypothetical protein
MYSHNHSPCRWNPPSRRKPGGVASPADVVEGQQGDPGLPKVFLYQSFGLSHNHDSMEFSVGYTLLKGSAVANLK